MKNKTLVLEIAKRLKRARLDAGYSQGEAARELKMHRPTISEIEAGRRRLTVDEAVQFCILYGSTVGYLVGGK